MSDFSYTIEPGKQEILIEETFEAPRDIVFELLNDASLLSEWWGPARLRTTVKEMDVRPGGRWRIIQRDADGTEYGFHGVYHEITPERIVRTFEYEGMPGHVILEVAKLEEVDGKTKVTSKSIFESVEDRDGMAQSGMEEGVRESHERFAKLLLIREYRRAA